MPDANRITALMLKGETFERLYELDSAETVYNEVTVSYPSSFSNNYAQWRIEHINAQTADSTIQDSLKSAHIHNLLENHRLDTTTSGGGGGQKLAIFDGKTEEELLNEIPDIDELAIKVNQNYPNPFFALTEIQYFLSKGAWAKLTIRDINGKVIANLIDKYVKGSWHSLIINGSGLSNGAYVVVLEADGKAVTKLIQKIR